MKLAWYEPNRTELGPVGGTGSEAGLLLDKVDHRVADDVDLFATLFRPDAELSGRRESREEFERRIGHHLVVAAQAGILVQRAVNGCDLDHRSPVCARVQQDSATRNRQLQATSNTAIPNNRANIDSSSTFI